MDATSIDNNEGYLVITKSGATTPHFKELVAENLYVPPLPYSLSFDKGDKTRASRGMARYNGHSYAVDYGKPFGTIQAKTWSVLIPDLSTESKYKGINSYINPITDSKVTYEVGRMNNKLLMKLKGQSLPIIMALKERKETGRLITGFLDKTIHALKVIRHPRQVFKAYRGVNPTAAEGRRLNKIHQRLLRRARQQSKGMKTALTAGDAWLQYRFAWMPLYKDILDTMAGAAKAMEKSRATFVRKGINKTVTGKTTGGPRLYFNWGEEGMYQFNWNVTITGHTKVFYRIDDATAALWSQFQDIPVVVWDSVPYSFVIDGLVNISQYLDLRNAVMGVRFDSGYTSLKYLSVCKVTPREVTHPDGPVDAVRHIYTTYPSARYQLNFSRSILAGFPSQMLEMPLLDYFNLTHIADLSALSLQLMKRKF